MQVIRPYGSSVVATGSTKRQLQTFRDPAAIDFPHFADTNPQILIAQWISAIDKIVRKPNEGDKGRDRSATDEQARFREQQLNFRSKLGEACWNLLVKSFGGDVDSAKLRRTWDWKLHPAGTDATKFKDGKLSANNIKGWWYESFLGKADMDKVDHEALGTKIQEHLFKAEIRRKDGEPRTHETQQGLVANRAKSVVNSTLSGRMGRSLDEAGHFDQMLGADIVLGWTEADETMFCNGKPDLATQIANDCKERRISSQDAGRRVFEHYGITFKDNGAVRKREEIAKDQSGLLALYDGVRTYYRELLKATSKGKDGLYTILPKSNSELFALLRNKHKNADVNDLIRLGRVLHYASTPDDADGFEKTKWHMQREEVAKSSYWSSIGQADIKRTEAFVRVWRHVLSLAARTMKTIADPNSNFKDKEDRPADVLSSDFIATYAAHQEVQTRMKNHLPLLFGSGAAHFRDLPGDQTAKCSLKLLAFLRNRVFHFKTRRSFVDNLSRNLASALDGSGGFGKAATALHKKDWADFRSRLVKEAEGAHLHKYSGKDALRKFLDEIGKAVENPVGGLPSLPKFNGLLNRVANSRKKDWFPREAGFSFPAVASGLEMKIEWKLAKFKSSKMIYEGPFRNALAGLPVEKLRQFVEEARELRTREARNLTGMERRDGQRVQKPHHDLIEAKTMDLPDVSDHDTIATYFDRLTSHETGEMRIQRGYEPNPEAAREAMEWIHEFRMDIVARAFAGYLQDERRNSNYVAFLKLDEETQPLPTPALPTMDKAPADATQPELWASLLYYVLHFVPVDDAAQLRHQFEKWAVLEDKGMPGAGATGTAAVPDAIKELRKALALYIAMHDDKHTGEGLALPEAGRKTMSGLFQRNEDFERVFKVEGVNEQQVANTMRGLREILRFGDLAPLQKAMGTAPITSEDVDRLLMLEMIEPGNNESQVAKAQRNRKKLHEEISKTRDRVTPDQVNEYAGYLEAIQKHRLLANKVQLSNHIRLHRLMMRVVSRLVDYCGSWERDGYFIVRALLWLQGRDPQSVFGDKAGGEFAKGKSNLQQVHANMDADFRKLLERYFPMGIDLQEARNDIAHFSFMNSNDVDLTEAINRVRELMAYDRKMKNAVSKSIFELLYEEGLEVSWKMDGHRLRIKDCESRKMQHLAGKARDDRLREDFHSDAYVKTVRHLFEANALLKAR